MSCLLTRPVACDGSGPPRSALREQTPIAVSELADQYLVRRITRASSSSPSHPTKGQLFSFGGLHGRLVGSTAVRFFDANGSGRLIPSAGAARHHPIYPGPEEHRETNRWHPQRKRSRHAGPRADALAGEDCSETAGRGHPSGNPARRNASASAAIFFGST